MTEHAIEMDGRRLVGNQWVKPADFEADDDDGHANNGRADRMSTATTPYRNTKAVTLRQCNHCKTRYQPIRSTSRFCSTLCRVQSNRKRKRRKVLYKSDSVEWPSPRWLFDELNEEFGFELDVCATAENALCERFYTKEDDGLQQPWDGVCWMNPPYGRTIGQWMQKASEAASGGATVVCLVPARTDTKWWQAYCLDCEVRFIKGRLRFGEGKYPAPFPSAVIVMRPTG